MPVQLNFSDKFGHENPEAFLRLERADWVLGSGGLQVTVRIYINKAAADAKAEPVHDFTVFVPFDTTSLTGGIEAYIKQLPEIAAGSPTTVSA